MTLGRAQSYPLFFTRLRATMTIPILFSPSRVLFRFSPPCNLSCRCWTPPFLFCSYRLLPLMLFQLNFQLLICLRLTIAIVQNRGKKRATRSGLGGINKSKQKRRGGSEGKQRGWGEVSLTSGFLSAVSASRSRGGDTCTLTRRGREYMGFFPCLLKMNQWIHCELCTLSASRSRGRDTCSPRRRERGDKGYNFNFYIRAASDLNLLIMKGQSVKYFAACCFLMVSRLQIWGVFHDIEGGTVFGPF